MSRADDEKALRDRLATLEREIATEARRKARLERQLAALDEGVASMLGEKAAIEAELAGPDTGSKAGFSAAVRRVLRDHGPLTVMEIARELVGTVEVAMGAQAAKRAGRPTKTVLRDKNAYSDVNSALGDMYRRGRVTRAKSDRGTVYSLTADAPAAKTWNEAISEMIDTARDPTDNSPS